MTCVTFLHLEVNRVAELLRSKTTPILLHREGLVQTEVASTVDMTYQSSAHLRGK